MTSEGLLDLFVLAPVGFVEIDANGRVDVANLAARRLLEPFAPGGAVDDLFAALAPVAPELAARARGFDAARGVVLESLELWVPGEGGLLLSLVKVAPERFVAILGEASALAAARAAASRFEQRLRAIDGAVRDYALFTVGPDGLIATWSESAERVHQWPASEIVGRSLGLLMGVGTADDAVRELLALAARDGWTEEEGERRRRDGSTFWASTVVTALRDAGGVATGFSVVTRDLSERRRLDEAARGEATGTVDHLTGALHRAAFLDLAGSEVARGRRYSQPLSLLLVNPDRLAETRDARGDAFVDEWLSAIASVCRQESRTTDVVGRVGGQEFAVLLPSTELSGGLVLAERIRERMQRHVFQGDHQGVRCTVCVGVAELSDATATVEALLDAAATAVQRAKQAGRNLVVGYDA